MLPLCYQQGLDQVDAVEGIFGNIREMLTVHQTFKNELLKAAKQPEVFANCFQKFVSVFSIVLPYNATPPFHC